MNDQIWSWLAGGIGLIGFWFSGKKYWWAWYINIVNQIAWAAFALITGYYVFLVTAVLYFVVFSRNAYLWTRDHFKSPSKELEKVGRAISELSINEARSMTGLDSFEIEPIRPTGPAWEPVTHRHQFKLRLGYLSRNTYLWECWCGEVYFYEKKKWREMMVASNYAHVYFLKDASMPICKQPFAESDYVISSDQSLEKADCPDCLLMLKRWAGFYITPLRPSRVFDPKTEKIELNRGGRS